MGRPADAPSMPAALQFQRWSLRRCTLADTCGATHELPRAAGHQFIGAMLEAATPRLGGKCTQELAQLKKAFGMSLKSGDTFLMSTDGEDTR